MSQDAWVTAVEEFASRARHVLRVPPGTTVEEVFASMEQQQQRLLDAEQHIEHTQVEVSSDDGLISVTMSGRMQVRSLVLADETFLRYTPRELGPAIRRTIDAAMAQCGEMVRDLLTGAVDEDVLDDVMATWPGRRAGDADGDDRPLADWA